MSRWPEHVTTSDIYAQALDAAIVIDARQERLLGQPLATADIHPSRRLNEVELRLLDALASVRRGERPDSQILFAAMAHLAALELVYQRSEMERVETGDPTETGDAR